MLLIYPVEAVYKIGQPFPIYSIPMDFSDAANESLEDFQWWAYSSDFKKWLDKNPRTWVADSVDNSQYNELTQMMIESSSVRYEWVDTSERKRISSFQDFVDYSISEADEASESKPEGSSGTSDEEIGKQAIKLHFAYNKLKTEGKLKDSLTFKGMQDSSDLAVIAALIDQETGNAAMESLIAYRMSPIKGGVNADSKIAMINLTEKLPGGPIAADATSESIVDEAVSYSMKAAAYSAVALVAFGAIKWASMTLGSAFLLRRGFKTIENFAIARKAAKGATEASKAIKGAGILSKTGKGIKTFWRAVTPAKAVSFWGKIGKAGIEGAKVQRALGRMEKAGKLAKGIGMAKGFVTGVKSASSIVKAAEWTNPIGWGLLAIDAIGSAWNWYSDNQAPMYKEVDDFAKGSFDPKSIEIGVPVTICWSQPAGGTWGAVVSFLANNETRTTMELVKVANDVKGYSVFIVTQINSKGLQEQMAKAGLTLIAFDNSDIIERGWLDNEDLDFKIWSIKDMNEIANFFMFEGYCDWAELSEEYRKSSSQLIISDNDAPNTYNFYFEDSEDGVINVSGKKVTDEDLAKYSDRDLQRIFGLDTVKGQFAVEPGKSANESVNTTNPNKAVSFKDFGSDMVFEKDGEDSEGVELTSEQLSTPAEVAIYIVTDKEYADPELRGKYDPGKFTNFMVRKEDYDAAEGEKIEVEVNTNEVIEDAKAGTYTFRAEPEVDDEKKPERKNEPVVDKGEGEDKDKEDKDKEKGEEGEDGDYYVTVDPNDVTIKNRRHSTLIKDKSVEDGVNVFDKFLSERDKEVLRIQNWKGITSAKEIRDNRGDTIIVKLVNREAPWGDRKRKYKITDGEPFEIAKKFVEETKDRIKYD